MGRNKEDSIMEEIWKDVPGYEGLYQVSDHGNVKSLNYRHTGKDKILRHGKTRDGYLQVGLWKDGVGKRYLVSLLEWTAFNGPIPPGIQVNHINERPWDNRLENLNLMTCKENINWGTGNRRRAKTQSEMVEQHTLDGTHICTWFSVNGIQRELGYSPGYISKCCNGKRKTAYGYSWKYTE